MSLHATALASVAALTMWPAPAPAQVPCEGAVVPMCEGDLCGCHLMAAGWRKIAACDGHNWSYLLQSDRRTLVCMGVSGRAGPIESPCHEFKGSLEQYRILAQRPVAARSRGECWLSPAVTGEQ